MSKQPERRKRQRRVKITDRDRAAFPGPISRRYIADRRKPADSAAQQGTPSLESKEAASGNHPAVAAAPSIKDTK